MTLYSGNDISVTFTGGSVPNAISFSAPDNRARIDVTAAGSKAQYILGLQPGECSVEAWLDTSNAALEAAIAGGYTLPAVAFKVADQTLVSFDYAYVVRSVSTQGPKDQAVKATYTFLNAPAADAAPVS